MAGGPRTTAALSFLHDLRKWKVEVYEQHSYVFQKKNKMMYGQGNEVEK
jgi:hypothetical protein